MKVLIVDDDCSRADEIKQLIITEISSDLHEVTIAHSCDEAKTILRQSYFDVLFLDVILPKRHLESPHYKNGLGLLDEINRRKCFNRPERIIGITANIDDIERYREKFSNYCFAVIEASPTNCGWQSALVNAIEYSIESGQNRKEQPDSIVITIHGIRTYGQWQERFKTLACAEYGNLEFYTYKYGYFTIPLFFMPWAREWEERKFTACLKKLIEENPNKPIKLFSHSFGAYLSVRAIERLAKSGFHVPLDLLVLSGSVLKSNYDWGPISGLTSAKVVNDCGSSDYVLWLSEAFIPRTGMAGRVGFSGFNNRKFVNRYHTGGHSLYFKGESFFNEHWLPLLCPENETEALDCRESSVLVDGILQRLVIFCGKIKELTYILAVSVFVYTLFYDAPYPT